jgi:hypothetical protein
MENNKLNRRNFMKKAALFGAIAPAATMALSACKGGSNGGGSGDCMDVSALSPADKSMRDTVKYVDATTIPDQTCGNCQLFIAPKSGETCGTCQVVKGPINTKGYCVTWAKKLA